MKDVLQALISVLHVLNVTHKIKSILSFTLYAENHEKAQVHPPDWAFFNQILKLSDTAYSQRPRPLRPVPH